jgi:Prophage CP4-57 regulatory protein (AlpA)
LSSIGLPLTLLNEKKGAITMQCISLPLTGYIRLPQLIGEPEVTPETAEVNKTKAQAIRVQFPITAKEGTADRKEQEKVLTRKLAKVGPRTPRPSTPAIYPVSKSTLWQRVKEGRFPSPVKLSERITAWRVEDVRAYIG